MKKVIGIRREDKNRWEGRTPLIPEDIRDLKERYDIEIIVQPSEIRGHKEDEFLAVNARISEDLTGADYILGIKEIPAACFIQGMTYLFFSHVIKGQPYNMPMLKRMMELGCNLLDYECIKDEKNRRLIAFGRFAGLSGIIDTLWAFGRRLKKMGISSPFESLSQTIKYEPEIKSNSERYPKLNLIKREFMQLGRKIADSGLPQEITPFIIGIAGYGNVSSGVQEMIDILPVKAVEPQDLENFIINKNYDNRTVYKVVFKEKDMVEPVDSRTFELHDYYQNPQFYRSVMYKYLNHLNILVNSIFWTEKYPRILTLSEAKRIFSNPKNRLLVIGDLSVDIKGAIELTISTTDIENPVYIYDIEREDIRMDLDGNGPLILAVDNLPCEFPRDSSSYFSEILKPFIMDLSQANFKVNYDEIDLPPSLKKALILHRGKLTPDYEYISRFL